MCLQASSVLGIQLADDKISVKCKMLQCDEKPIHESVNYVCSVSFYNFDLGGGSHKNMGT